jgi:peroxiredoxin
MMSLRNSDPPDVARRSGLVAMLATLALAAGSSACSAKRMVPDVEYTLLDGSAGRTLALRGQVVLVTFWATSCAPCVAGMPALVATHQRFAPQGLVTLAVAMQYDAPAAVSQFAEARQLPFGVVIDNTGAMARAFGDVQRTPTHAVIDRRGAIVQQATGEPDAAKLHALLKQLLAQA